MALPTVAINNGTGSDTAASGAGPATALSGTAAATAASTVVTLLVDNPDLSGVATDGSAVIWVGSSSGKQFAKITGTNNTAGVKTVTVSDAFANTESGKNWGIGGKRKSIANANTQRLFQDFLAGWTVDVQDTQPTLTAALTVRVTGTAANPATITSTSGTAPTVTTATNSINLLDISSCTFLTISNIAFTNTAGTKGTSGSTGCALTPPSGNCSKLWVDRCSFDGFQVALCGDNITNFAFDDFAVTRSEIKNSVSDGIRAHKDLRLDHCRLHANGGHGATGPSNQGSGPWNFTFTEFSGNTGSGYRHLATGASGGSDQFLSLANCTFRDNGAAGVKFDDASGGIWVNATYNVFYNNTTYGMDFTNSGTAVILGNYGNAYGANGTADRNNFAAGNGDVALSASPFTSSTDSGLNATAGGGAAVKATASVAPNASANPAGDAGAVPSGGGAAGGGLLVHAGMTGGISG